MLDGVHTSQRNATWRGTNGTNRRRRQSVLNGSVVTVLSTETHTLHCSIKVAQSTTKTETKIALCIGEMMLVACSCSAASRRLVQTPALLRQRQAFYGESFVYSSHRVVFLSLRQWRSCMADRHESQTKRQAIFGGSSVCHFKQYLWRVVHTFKSKKTTWPTSSQSNLVWSETCGQVNVGTFWQASCEFVCHVIYMCMDITLCRTINCTCKTIRDGSYVPGRMRRVLCTMIYVMELMCMVYVKNNTRNGFYLHRRTWRSLWTQLCATGFMCNVVRGNRMCNIVLW